MPVSEHNPYVRRWDKRVGEMYYEHRAWAELKLGRPLRAGEVVHHADGDKVNNHPDNIVIFSSHSAHMVYEHYQRRRKRGITHLFSVEELLAMHGLWMVR